MFHSNFMTIIIAIAKQVKRQCLFCLFDLMLYVHGKQLRSCLDCQLLNHTGGAVAWWLTPRTPDPEVGGSSPTRVAVLSLSKTYLPQKKYW